MRPVAPERTGIRAVQAAGSDSAGVDLKELDRNLETFRRRLRTRVRRALRESVGDGPGGGAFAVLERLVVSGPMAPAVLAAQLEVRTSTMTAHIDRLSELGWARRETVPQGPGRVRVSLTDEGRLAYERYLDIRREALGSLVASLTDGERRTLTMLLGQALQRMPEGCAPDLPHDTPEGEA